MAKKMCVFLAFQAGSVKENCRSNRIWGDLEVLGGKRSIMRLVLAYAMQCSGVCIEVPYTVWGASSRRNLSGSPEQVGLNDLRLAMGSAELIHSDLEG